MTLEEVIKAVEVKTGFTLEQIKSRDRHSKLVDARHILFYLFNKYFFSLVETAKTLNIVAHATVIHGKERIIDELSLKTPFAMKYGKFLFDIETRLKIEGAIINEQTNLMSWKYIYF